MIGGSSMSWKEMRGPVRLLPVFVLFLTMCIFVGATLPLDARAETSAPKPPADSTRVAPDTTASPHRVIAYYFHTTKRCVSCRKIEAYSQEAIETGFPEDLKSGRLVWRVVNIEEKGNEHFVKDYQLYTKSLILVDERDGKQAAWKNLPKVWEYLNDKAKFVHYVQEETRAFLTTEHE